MTMGLATLMLVVLSLTDDFQVAIASCGGGVGKCHWIPWESWSDCSETCGGGRRYRTRHFCCDSDLVDDIEACFNDCGKNVDEYYSGRSESQNCNTQCFNGGSYSNGCQCQNEYYGNCCEHDCPLIQNCKNRQCTNRWNNICLECNNDDTFFKRTYGDRQCERMCAWNGHYCWPGTCSNDLTRGCRCAHEFQLTNTSSETSCQPTKLPTILTCDTTVSVGANGTKKQALSDVSSTSCNNLKDVYGNQQPTSFQYRFLAEFTINYSGYSKPPFIVESNFGITDATIYLIQSPVVGVSKTTNHNLLQDTRSSTQAKTHWDHSGQIRLTSYILQNGESLCIKYEAKGGGYLRSKSMVTHKSLLAVPYDKTTTSEQICYYYDDAPPAHCSANSKCSFEPLQIPSRITRSTNTTVSFSGWTDPIPAGGRSIQASSIESYSITVNEVLPSSGTLNVDITSNVVTKLVNSSSNSIDLYLESDNPRLYSITLEVKDVADNVQQARRFMLYDNSSYIEISQDNPYRVTSASVQTGYTWQTHHHNITLSWKNHFLNKFYYDNPLLNDISPDAYGLISGIYEQNTGLLPVTGTPNVYGIVKFNIAWCLNRQAMTKEMAVPDFLNQSFSQDLKVKDGQSYLFQIKSIDIAGNTLTDNVTVHIDRSPPHINNMWLVKDGHKTLFVHHNTDLSHMQMQFEALDQHSGLRNIEWRFGLTDAGMELTSGNLSVGETHNTSCPVGALQCYCPDIGQCEYFNYTVPLNKLVDANKHVGNHNRNYYFTVKVTNNARLTNIEHLDILVDDSPPEPGVIYEGPIDSNDIDYTSEDSFTVHWHGFIDHESGIKEYRVALSHRCLAQNELYNTSVVSDIEYYGVIPRTESSVSIPADFIGKRYVSIVGLNNAMDPSSPVCSDGITRDLSPPELRNITFEHASWSESIVCHQGNVWLFHSSLTKVQLQNHTACRSLCTDLNEYSPLAPVLPLRVQESRDIDVAEFLCTNLPTYNNETIIYLPNNHIAMKWDIEEFGSQIDDFYFALGANPSELNAPRIESYTSLSRRRHFSRRHTGIGSNELFYIFIKTVNKAKNEKVTVIGPVLIDETPPLNRKIPEVTILDNKIVVGWDNDTFYDLEQDEPINSIFWKIGHGKDYVTPLFQWGLYSSEPCPRFSGGCFKYSLHKLQLQDTDLGLEFHIKMNVYNNAGHDLQIRSEEFQLPSKYAPGHGVVLDLDPYTSNLHQDTNVHFSPQTLCVEWLGFRHHQSVLFELGIGRFNKTDDVISFIPLNTSSPYCINSSALFFGVKYFSLIRATCSGGTTISSSDGVIIMNEIDILKSLYVQPGESCSTGVKSNIETHIIGFDGNELNFTFEGNIGQSYRIGSGNDSWKVTSKDGILSELRGELRFVPFTINPALRLVSNTENVSISLESFLTIVHCPPSKYYASINHLSTHWYSQIYIPKGITFETAIASRKNGTDLGSAIEYITPFLNVGREYSHDFYNVSIAEGYSYTIAVKACSSSRCVGPVLSEPFGVNPALPKGTIKDSTLQDDAFCSRIHIIWEKFASKDKVLFYQWTISKDVIASHILTDWHTEGTEDTDIYEVSRCVTLPLYHHSLMYSCIRAYTDSGLHSTVCSKLQYLSIEKYKSDIVYDFNGNSLAWPIIAKVLSSSNIGDTYALLHDNEMNVATSNADVLGVMLYATERNITWSLMKIPTVPTDCKLDKSCVSSTVTNDGYVRFDPMLMHINTLYYTCGHSKLNHVVREMHTEIQEEISACSNGFILDDAPPMAGNVIVSNTSGYLTSVHLIRVAWDEFDDKVDATLIGYRNKIAKYRFAIGYQPGLEDVFPFTDVGHNRQSYIEEINVTDGSILFLSVEGTDYAGFTTVGTSNEVIVDTSPPAQGEISFDLQHYSQLGVPVLTTSSLVLHLTGFDDEHSGIAIFQVGVGTQSLVDDIMPMTNYFEKNVMLDLNEQLLVDGYGYYVLITAVNRAGLKSPVTSSYIMVDRSSPTGGQILDGHILNEKDLDYQSNMKAIRGHWKGFDDIHSGISFYRAGLGTKPYADDIEPLINVGLNQDIAWKGIFKSGQRYYILTEACNGAGLCTQRSSDGIVLDNSPPTKGIIWVGSEDYHRKYLPHRSTLHVRWNGFDDPQSGIDDYEVCIGTRPLLCDIQPLKNCLLRSNIMLTGLRLPTQSDLYATVIAFNHVGLNISKTSDSFRIDDSAPIVIKKPSFNRDYNSINDKTGQWDKSVLRIYWEFNDDESPVSSHDLSLVTHHEGHTPVEHLQLRAQNEITLSLEASNWLHNGDKYTAVVTSCNEAGLCFTEESEELLIDSTPPHVGGFKPPLTWQNYLDLDQVKSNISLTWYGFHDQESGVEKYNISASRSYSGNELLSDAIVDVKNDDKSPDFNQMLTLSDAINPDDVVILTIWAENAVGLNSTVARLTVNAITTTSTHNNSQMQGLLELEKHSCDIHYCNKDCTCAVLGKPCVEVQANTSCTTLNITSDTFDRPSLEVHPGLQSHPANITASSSCLAAHWRLSDGNISSSGIQRFEWSMGLLDQPVGDGIFDLKLESPWHDVGLRTQAVHCLPVNKSLQHGHSYVMYVKVWYAMDLNAIFTSEAMKVDQTAPSVGRGKTVIESDSLCSKDIDIIDWMDTITACWTNVFTEQQGTIVYFTVSLGTASHSDDVLQVTNTGLNTTITLNDLSLAHGTRYFFTVTAYNDVGLQRSTTSDGFVVDMDVPNVGVVFNTGPMKNTEFQSANTSLSFSWHGFQDLFSGIQKYMVAVTTDPLNENELYINFTDVRFNTKWTFDSLHLDHGMTYYGLVHAVDYSGHSSEVVSSDSITIDTTPPQGYLCQHFSNVETDTSQSSTNENVLLEIKANLSIHKLYRVHGQMSSLDKTPRIILNIGRLSTRLPVALSHDGTILFDYDFLVSATNDYNITIGTEIDNSTIGVSLDECDDVVESMANAVRIQQVAKSTVAVKTFILDRESSLKRVLVGAGTTLGGFQIKPLSPIHHRNNNDIIYTHVPHGTPVHVTVIAENHAGLKTTFRASSIILDHTEPRISDIVGELRYSEVNVSDTNVLFTNVSVTWTVSDEESGIKYCFCSLGSSPGWTNIQKVWQSNTLSSCNSDDIEMPHGTVVYANIKCVNNIEISTDASSEPLVVAIKSPMTTSASVSFIPLNEESSQYTSVFDSNTSIQSSRAAVQLRWDGFKDSSGLNSYEYRILNTDNVVVEWESVGKRQVVSVDDIHLSDGTYQAEVRAFNVGDHVSDSVNASMIIVGGLPRLTGQPVSMSEVDDVLHIDWSHVFQTTNGVLRSFSLYVGTRLGFADVIDLPYTSGTSFDFKIPTSTLITPHPTELFIKVECIYATGLRSSVNTSYKL